MADLLLLFVIVLGVNLLPALGPPTWSILVLYTLNTNLPTALVVFTGASAAALGRFLLALAFQMGRSFLSERSRSNLLAARAIVQRSRGKTLAGLALFALSPLPSAQLFEAAGLVGVRLFPFTTAFFAGRLVSYFIYASAASKIRATSLGEAFREVFRQPVGVALQLALIALLAALTRVNWSKWVATSDMRLSGTQRKLSP